MIYCDKFMKGEACGKLCRGRKGSGNLFITSAYAYQCDLEVEAHPVSSAAIHCNFQQCLLKIIDVGGNVMIGGKGFTQPSGAAPVEKMSLY